VNLVIFIRFSAVMFVELTPGFPIPSRVEFIGSSMKK